jgi:WD40 repeat protein
MTGRTWHLGACAFFPEENLIVTGGEDGSIGIWNALTGAMVRHVDSSHRGSIYTCAVSPDGLVIATGGFDESVHLHNARSGELSDLQPLEDDVVLCLFSPHGERLLCVASGESGKNEVTVWHLGDEEGIYNLDADNGPQLRFSGREPCAFSPDGRTIAICPKWGALTLHDVETGEVQTTLEIPGLRGCVFIGGQKFLVTTSEDQLVELWDTTKGRRLAAFPTGDKPTALAYCPATREIAVGGFDGGFYRLRVHLRTSRKKDQNAPTSRRARARA